MTELIELRESGISKRQDNLQTFELLEMAAVDRAKKSFENATEAAYYIHLILKHRLWRHIHDEDGNQKYFKQNHYLRELEAKVGWGRSSIFEYDGAWKFGTHLGFKTLEEVNGLGGIHILRMLKEHVQQAGTVDSKGRIREYNNPLKPKDVSNEEWLREKAIQFSPLNGDPLRPYQLKEEMQVIIAGKPTFHFELEPLGDTGGWDVRWSVRKVDPKTRMIDFETGLISDGTTPDYVMRLFCRKLFIKWITPLDEGEVE